IIYQVSPKVEFTNIKCTSLDLSFSSFDYCHIKAVNRSFKYLSLKVKLHKVPITKIKVNIAVLKRFNGYRPFMYNVTVDACRFIRNPKSNPVFSYLYSLFKTYSNMNHTCPYNHDLIVEKLNTQFVNNQVTAVLPVPEGDYIFETNWFAENIQRAVVRVYGTLS
ncbi:uncharacterized protein, partial [Drosophila kikkawai]|uniref:Uncharacterized protein n=1 Tax=Drosophila kikkawai TaxID=30033 RepID=A0A6P4IQD3_DROKI